MRSSPLKRRRPVTACLECYRRKQKCNRVQPCNICISRNIPEKCIYERSPNSLDARKSENDTSPVSSDLQSEAYSDQQYESTATASPTLDEQIGYSTLNTNNTYSGLQKSLRKSIRNPGWITPYSTLRTAFQRRYLQLAAQLPGEQTCRNLIEVYFNEADWYFMCLDKHFFLRQYSLWVDTGLRSGQQSNLQLLSRDLHYFPALLFQLLAVGLQFLHSVSPIMNDLQLNTSEDCDELGEKYSRLALEIMALLGRHKPAITTVEYDLMRTTWLKNCSRGSESWHSVGNALRIAQELGLHLQSDVEQTPEQDLSENLNQLWFDQHKRRVWARLFILDSHMALILSRPRHINKDDCTVVPPTDCDIPEFPFNTFPFKPSSRQPPSSSTFIIFLYEVGLKIHEMLSCGANKTHIRDYEQVLRLDRDIRMILENLPPVMRPQNPDTSWDSRKPHLPKLRYQIVSTSHAYLMNLHRAHVAIHDRSREAATAAALTVLESQQLLFDLLPENQHKIHGFSFYSIDAGMFLSARTIDHPPHDRELLQRIRHALQQAISRLELLKGKSPVAGQGEIIFRQCYQKIHEISFNVLHSVSGPDDGVFDPDFSNMSMDGFNIPGPPQIGLQAVPTLFDAGMSQYDTTQLIGSDMFAFGSAEQEYFLFNLGQNVGSSITNTGSDISWDIT